LIRDDLVATAVHALDNNDANLVAFIPPNDRNSYQPSPPQGIHYIPLKLKDADPIHDLALLEPIGGIRYPNLPQISSSDAVVVGETVQSFGYPHATFGSAIIVLQEAIVGAKVLVTKGTIHVKHIIINQQSVSGQSGAPVYQKRTGNLIGVLIGAFAIHGGAKYPWEE